MHNLAERTGQVQYSTTRQSSRVRTHEKNSADAVRRLGKLIQSIFVSNQLVFETFIAPFLPTRLPVPGGSPRIGFTDIRYIAGAVRNGEYQGG